MEKYTRREIIKISWSAFIKIIIEMPGITALAKRSNANQGLKRNNESVNWDAFISEISNQAEAQTSPTWNQDLYVERIGTLANHLKIDDPSLIRAFRKYRDTIPYLPELEVLYRQQTFQITLASFEKGEVIPHHDHLNMTGVLVCLSGKLAVQSYDLLDERPDEKSYLIKSAGETLLEPGQSSTLTAASRNIHRVEGLTFSQSIDIFTPPYDETNRSKWYRVESQQYQGRTGVFRALTL